MDEDVMSLVDGLRKQVKKVVSEIAQDPKMIKVNTLMQALSALEASEGLPKTLLTDLFGFKDAVIIKPAEFYGLSHLEAAKRYIRKKGEAARFDEIAAGIRSGGLELNGSDEEKLKMSLARSTMEIVKVAGDFYGLLEFFPHVKRTRKRRGAADADEAENGESGTDDSAEEPEEEMSKTETASEHKVAT